MKKRFHAILTAALALLMLLSIPAHMTSCALNVKAEELSAGFTRAATEEGEITEAFKTAMADFALTLTHTVVSAEKEGKANHLVSPLSAMICLSVLANGAGGETLAQMEAVLTKLFLYFWSRKSSSLNCPRKISGRCLRYQRTARG